MPTKTPSHAPLVPISSDPRYANLVSAVLQCWDSIGSDALDPDNGGEDMANKDCIEMCIDADRLTWYPGGPAGDAANAFVRECAGTKRYAELINVLDKSCSLN